jgi:hypothetical protein
LLEVGWQIMIRRLSIALICLAVVASACASSSDVSSSTDDVASSNDDGSEAVEETNEAPTDQTTTTTTPLDGPTTTFVPNLDGPFDTSGGLQFDPATADVIVDADADPGFLGQYPWPTDWTRRTVEDWREFQPGLGSQDPRDGIPPIDTPVFETVTLASQWLSPRDPGALVRVDGEARFYPLSIMTRHEIVNDAFGDVPVAVTFCPLCNTAIAYDRRVNGEVLRFGVSGLLRNSDLVMWDQGTTSLWQQITGVGVVGEFAGAQLESVSTSIVSFSQFVESFPDGKSLSPESGLGRRYGTNPYSGYSSLDRPFLFRGETDDRLPALSRVVGVSEGDVIASYSFERLEAERVIKDEFDGLAIAVFFGGDTADALDESVIAASQAIGSAVAHDPVVEGQTLTFVANDDGGFVDDQTGSTWSIVGVALDGELAGTQLGSLQHRNEFWFAWQAFFGPESLREA